MKSDVIVIFYYATLATSSAAASGNLQNKETKMAMTERRLEPSKAEASTFWRTRDNAFLENHHPNYAVDYDPATAWCAGPKNDSVGDWLRLSVGPVADATSIRLRIKNGFQSSPKLFGAYHRVMKMTVTLLPSNTSQSLELKDTKTWQDIKIGQKQGALEAVELRIDGVSAASYERAPSCLSEIQIFATAAEQPRPSEETSRSAALQQWKKERLAPKKLPWIAVSAGEKFTCGIKSDGTLACWGDNTWGQLDVIEGKYAKVHAGSQHVCALRTDGTATCWGNYYYNGSPTIPPGAFAQLAGGDGYPCGLRHDGSAICWGDQFSNGSKPPETQFRNLSKSLHNACGVRMDGKLVCWGVGKLAQQTPPAGEFSVVSVASTHACAIRKNGAVICWRPETPDTADDHGQTSPPEGEFASLAVADSFGCAMRAESGTVACWGAGNRPASTRRKDNEENELHFGQSVPPAGRFAELTVGDLHACALDTSGKMSCWGLGRTMEDYHSGWDEELGQAWPP